MQAPLLRTLNNVVSQSLETVQHVVRPPSSHQEGAEAPPRVLGRGALEFLAIVSQYPHVSWNGFVWEDFCAQTQTEFDAMISDPAAKVSHPHMLALKRLFRDHHA